MTDEEIFVERLRFVAGMALIDICLKASNENLSEMRRENREIKERLIKLESFITLREMVEIE